MSTCKHVLAFTLILGLLSIAFPLISTPASAAAVDTWVVMNSGTLNNLKGVWGSSATNVFAVGTNGTILHYNGGSWSTANSGTSNDLNGVWGTSSSNIFAVGANGTILHYNGSSWGTMNSGISDNLNGVWGISATNIFAVGVGGTILNYNGMSWSTMTSNTTADLYGIWGSSPDNIWAVGTAYSIMNFNGTIWSSTTFPLLNNNKGIWGTSASQIFLVGKGGLFPAGYIENYDGSFWNDMGVFIPGGLFGIYGFSSDNVYAVGGGGAILHFVNSWSDMTSPTSFDLSSVWGACAEDIFAVGDLGTILHLGNGCPSNNVSSSSVDTSLGPVNFVTSAGSISGLVNLPPDSMPCSAGGFIFPFGMFSYSITNLAPGSTATITIRTPISIPMGAKVFKCQNGSLVDFTQYVQQPDPNTFILTLKDGGQGDSDGQANGIIVDPCGPAFMDTSPHQSSAPQVPKVAQGPAPIANIAVQSASLSTAKVAPGAPVTITANVANKGTANGSSQIKLYVNGQEEAHRGVTLSSGGRTPVKFTVSRDEPGTYSVYVGSIPAGTFEVDTFADPNLILYFSGALIIFAVVFGAIYITRRNSKY